MSRILSLLCVVALSACTSSTQTEVALKGAGVRWGSSFGMCVGYCREILAITPTELRLTRETWNSTQPTLVDTLPFTQAEWQHLRARLDAARIDRLQEVYGCPDCADGGAEWVEAATRAGQRRVTFDYGRGPDELQSVLQELRVLRQRFPSWQPR